MCLCLRASRRRRVEPEFTAVVSAEPPEPPEPPLAAPRQQELAPPCSSADCAARTESTEAAESRDTPSPDVAAAGEPPRPDAESAAPEVAPGHWAVELRRPAPAVRWGLLWDAQAMDKRGERMVERISPGSIADEWNRTHPGMEVRTGDVLVSVNGKAGTLEATTVELARSQCVICEFRPGDGRAIEPVRAASASAEGSLASQAPSAEHAARPVPSAPQEDGQEAGGAAGAALEVPAQGGQGGADAVDAAGAADAVRGTPPTPEPGHTAALSPKAEAEAVTVEAAAAVQGPGPDARSHAEQGADDSPAFLPGPTAAPQAPTAEQNARPVPLEAREDAGGARRAATTEDAPAVGRSREAAEAAHGTTPLPACVVALPATAEIAPGAPAAAKGLAVAEEPAATAEGLAAAAEGLAAAAEGPVAAAEGPVAVAAGAPGGTPGTGSGTQTATQGRPPVSELAKLTSADGPSAPTEGSVAARAYSAGAEEPRAPGRYVVSLTRTAPTEKFGFIWDAQAMDKQHLRVIDRISPGSLAEQWNRSHPDRTMSPGDTLVRVNGRSGGLELLSRELSRGGQVACEFQSAEPGRPREARR